MTMIRFKVLPQNSPGTVEDHENLSGQLIYQAPPERMSDIMLLLQPARHK